MRNTNYLQTGGMATTATQIKQMSTITTSKPTDLTSSTTTSLPISQPKTGMPNHGLTYSPTPAPNTLS